jgi:hypothetical protein
VTTYYPQSLMEEQWLQIHEEERAMEAARATNAVDPSVGIQESRLRATRDSEVLPVGLLGDPAQQKTHEDLDSRVDKGVNRHGQDLPQPPTR